VPPSLRTVADNPELALLVRAGAAGLDAPVRWVHVSELADPGPFLEGGELLLTTGMRLGGSAPAARSYVDRLGGSGVCGLGLAVGLGHDAVPKALVNACEKAGLPLLEVPVETPFIAIGKTVSALLAAEEYDELARSADAQRALTRAALVEEGRAGVVSLLAQQVGGWALLLDPRGEVVKAAPATASGRALDVAGEVERLRSRGVLAGASIATAVERITVQPLGVGGRARGYLVVGAPEPWGASRTALVNLAVSLLTLEAEQGRSVESARRALQSSAVRLALRGDVADLPLRDLGWGAVLDGPLQLVVGAGNESALAALLDGVEEADTGAVAARLDDGVVVLVPGALDLADVWGGPSVAVDLRLGASEVGGVDELAAGLRRARQALASVPPGVDGIARYDELAGSGLLGLVDPQAADGFADAVLAPLTASPAAEDLLASLDAWLGRHGQWDSAASQLGVHRHTLRHRMRRVEQLLGRSLDDPAVRMELWFALRRRALRDEGPPLTEPSAR
jgi:PucR family transcriptional regulator, purine catabolism regulatory protein